MKMGVLGGRTPMNVVMGLNPSLPASLRAGLVTEEITAEEYVKSLVDYLRDTHKRVRQYAEQMNFEKEGTDRGDQGAARLVVGDIVALKSTDKRKGESRFGHRTDGEIYKITQVVGENICSLGKLTTGVPPVAGYPNRYAAERLIKLDMPEFELDMPEGTPQRVEIYDEYEARWKAATTERWAVDGRVSLRFDEDKETCAWVDLTKCRYRWLTGPVGVPRAQEE